MQIANAVSSQFQTSCEYSIKSSKVETNDPKDSQIEDIHKQFEEILKKSCPGLCSNRGKCNNDDGTCICDPGKASDNLCNPATLMPVVKCINSLN